MAVLVRNGDLIEDEIVAVYFNYDIKSANECCKKFFLPHIKIPQEVRLNEMPHMYNYRNHKIRVS